MSEGATKRDWGLAFLVGLMAFVATANLTLDILSPRTVITQNHYEHQTANHAPSEEKPEGFWWWWPGPDSWVALFTGTLTLATIGLWVSTQRTLRHAERTSERQLRAYVMVDNIRLENPRYPRKWVVRAQMKNFGATPARKVVAVHSGAIEPYPFDWSKWKKTRTLYGQDMSDILAPGGNGVSPWVGWDRAPRSGLALWVRMLRREQWAMYFMIEITYEDVFGNVRTTEQIFMCKGWHHLRTGKFESVYTKDT